MGKQWKQYTETLFSWAPKSLWMVTAAMKLKDACSLKEKLWPTSVHFSSVAQSCPTLCNPVNRSTPGLPAITNSQSPAKPTSFSQWCHPAISSSIVPFSSCLQSFPASGSFQMSHLLVSGGQNIGVSASTSVLPMNTQDWSPSGLTGWISLQSNGTLKSLLQYHSSKASTLRCSTFFMSNSHIHIWPLEKP